ncbi:hypothetical protein ACJJTC_014331 [Scirpophaga incertulas]
MARISFILVLLCQTITIPMLGGRGDDENPFLDLASSFIQNMGDGTGDNGLGAIGSIMGSLMQGDNAKNLGAMFGQSLNGGGNTGDVLSGLGSLLGGQDGKMDPAFIGSMISMFAQQMGSNEEPKRQKRQNKPNNEFNIESIMNIASNFMGNKNGGSILPVIMSTLNSLSEPEAQKRAHDHKDHASFLPPFLEKAHLYWDLFINSELGKGLWEKSGLRRAFKAFTGPDGRLSFEMIFKNFENHSFRRHWIKAAAKYLTDTVVQNAKPEVYQRYLASGQYILNGFLDAQGLPKNIHFDMTRPETSLTKMINYILSKYMDLNTDVSEYVKPAIAYIKQTVKMAESASQNLASRSDYHALADRLTDTLNLEVIEPVLRVFRAYKALLTSAALSGTSYVLG